MSTTTTTSTVTIVIPAYNEAERITPTLRALHAFLAPVSLITIDRLGTIVAVNCAAEDALRTTRAALIDRRLALFVAEAARGSSPTRSTRRARTSSPSPTRSRPRSSRPSCAAATSRR